MLHLRSASRACLRALLLASVVAFGGIANASDTVDLQFKNVNPGVGVNYTLNSTTSSTTAGAFNWWKTAGTGFGTTLFGSSVAIQSNPSNLATNAKTFCIELQQYISPYQNVQSYTITANLSGLPQTSLGAGMGAVKAQNLQILAALTGTAGFWSTYSEAVFQAAIWNIVYDVDMDAANGVFKLVTGNVQALLNAVLAGTTTGATQFFLGLTNNGVQDQITLVDQGGFTGGGGVVVPVPTGVVMAGMGVVCLGGFNFLRRRKNAAKA